MKLIVDKKKKNVLQADTLLIKQNYDVFYSDPTVNDIGYSTGICRTWPVIIPVLTVIRKNTNTCNIYLPPSNVVTDCVGEAGSDPTWLNACTVT
jgi:hypothetical protein